MEERQRTGSRGPDRGRSMHRIVMDLMWGEKKGEKDGRGRGLVARNGDENKFLFDTN